MIYSNTSKSENSDLANFLISKKSQRHFYKSTKYFRTDSPPKQITFQSGGRKFELQAGPAQFGKDLKTNSVSAKLVMANHVRACGGSLQNGDSMWGKIVVVERGDCMFVEKARVVQSLGAVGGIVLDTTEGTAAATRYRLNRSSCLQVPMQL